MLVIFNFQFLILKNYLRVIFNNYKIAIQIACRVNAYGENYEFAYSCSSCGEKNESSINLIELKHYEVDFDKIKQEGGIFITLPTSGAVVKSKVLTGGDDLEMQKRIKQKQKHNLPEEQLIERYRQIILSIGGNDDPLFVTNFIKNMPLRDSKYFMKEYSNFLPGVDFTFELECNKCGTVNKGGVPVGLGFFYPN